MQCAPGLDVGAVHGDGGGLALLVGDGCVGDGVGHPLRRHPGVSGLEDGGELEEEAVEAVVGLRGVLLGEPERVVLLVGHGVDDAGDLDEVSLVVTGESVDLARDQGAADGQGAVPAEGSVEERAQDGHDAGAVDDAAGQLKVVGRGRPSSGVVERRAVPQRQPWSVRSASAGPSMTPPRLVSASTVPGMHDFALDR